MRIATKSGKFDISEEKSTKNIANKFLTILKKGDIVFLYGEIGVGKTTFTKHLINGFQKKNKLKLTTVASPTFNLVYEYEINKMIIQHYDLFRLKHKNESKNIGLFENNSNVLTLIEWPEKIFKKPLNVIELFFEYHNNLQKRALFIKGLKINDLNEFK